MEQGKIKKSIVIHQGALGDLVCTVPGIAALGSVSEQIIGIGSSRLKLLEYAGILDKAVLSEALAFHRLFLEEFDPGPGLRSIFEGAEAAVSWLGRKTEPFQKNLACLAGKISVFREQFPPPSGASHVCRVLARPVIDLGIEVSDFAPKLNLPHAPEVIQRLPLLPARFIAVHPGSGGTNKSIPLPGLFRILGSLARLSPELKLLILAGEADKTLLIELIKNMPAELKPVVQLIDNVDLLVLAEILSKAEIFVGMDSGPAHLAAAVGTRTVVIFGPSDPKIWAPPQPWARAVSGNCDCAPCSDHERRNCASAKCLAAIDDQAVAKTAQDLLLVSWEKNAKII